MQMDNSQKLERSVEAVDPCDKISEIYEATMKQILEANRSYPSKMNQEKLQAQADIQYKAFIEKYELPNREEIKNGTFLFNQQSSQWQKQVQEVQNKCYMKKLKTQYKKQGLILPSLKDALFYHEIFMKQNKINFAKARRMQKEVSNLVLLNFFQFKAMPLPQQLEQSDQQVKEELNRFYEEEIEKVKKYFPEDYQHIFALSTATGRMTIKKRKKKDDH